ncbi:MAG: colicin V synthesis protein [Coxiella sp. (in: Bacteria)]|nr:MAG: colicin V synthesis protein [Coxiella sp. (in: g-proteobacteria)]
MSAIPWYDLNWFDYAIIGVVALSTVVSFFRGFIREALSLLIWVIGIIVAFKFSPALQQYIHQITKWGVLSYVVAFALIFLSVWLLGLLINLALRSVVKRAGLGGTDRMVGLVFGFLRGFLMVAVIMMFIDVSPFKNTQLVKNSALVPQFKGIVAMLDQYVPKDVGPLAQWAMGRK